MKYCARGRWIERQKGNYPDMLFDREKDPLEVENLIGRPDAAAAERELRDQLAGWIRRTPNATGKPLQPLGIEGGKR